MDMTPTIRRWAWFAAVTLGLTAAWYALYAAAVTAPPPPEAISGASQEHNVAEFLAWFRDGLWQDIGILMLATLGFLAVAGLGQALTRQPREEGAGLIGWDTAGRILIVSGILGAVAQSFQLGGHQAIAVASDALLRLDGVSLLHFTIDRIHAGLEVGVYGLLGAGLLAATIAGRARRATLAWVAVGALTGVTLVVLAWCRLMSDPLDIADPLLLAAALVLFPAWAAGLPGALGSHEPQPHGRAAAVANG